MPPTAGRSSSPGASSAVTERATTSNGSSSALTRLAPIRLRNRSEEADPLTTFDLRRFNAVRGQQGQSGREISRCLKELRLLRKDARAQDGDQPEDLAPHEQNCWGGWPPTASACQVVAIRSPGRGAIHG